jgi:hypothetical protein
LILTTPFKLLSAEFQHLDYKDYMKITAIKIK